MINTAYIGNRKLLFGTYAARRFCEHTGCSNEPSVILAQLLNPATLRDALLYIVWSGLQAEAASQREPFRMDEYGVTELYDAATESEGEQISYAFIGAVLNKAADQVPAFLESLRTDAEAKAAQEAADLKAVEAAGNPNPAAPLSPTGSKSKNGDTSKA